MKVFGSSKGYARQTMKVVCKDCGTDSKVHYDMLNDAFICTDCIDKEQNEIDDKEHGSREELLEEHEELIYRRGVDDEKDV